MVIIIVTWAKVMFVLILNYLRFLLLIDYNLQSVVIQSYANNIDGELQDKMFRVMTMTCCYPLISLSSTCRVIEKCFHISFIE